MSVLDATAQIIAGAQTEIMIFIIAVIAHRLLFGRHSLLPPSLKGKRPQGPKRGLQGSSPGEKPARAPEPRVVAQVARSLSESMLQGATRAALSAELDRHLQACPQGGVAEVLVGLLELVGGKAATPELLAAVRATLKSRGIKPKGRLLDLILRAYLALPLQGEFDEAVAEAEGIGSIPIGVALLSSRAALQSSGLEAALARMQTFASQWRAGVAQTASAAPHNFFREIVRSAIEQAKLPAVLQQLHACGIFTSWAVDCALAECLQQGEAALMWTVAEAARSRGVDIPAAAHCKLARGAVDDAAVLEIYDTHLRGADVCADTPAARRVVEAAVRRRRPEVTADVLAASKVAHKRVALLKSFSSEGRHSEAMAVFRACPEKTSSLYNAVLDACIVDGRDMPSLKRIMSEAEASGAADLVTYNTMIKAHLQAQDLQGARAALEAMQAAGFEPNTVTFNELIDASIKTCVHDAWKLVGEMEAYGLKPNRVTCSILLKSCQHNSRAADVERTMAFLGSMEEEMDEVLLSSACEACVRVGREDLLRHLLARQRSDRHVQVNGAHTFGSLIRAHGYVGDVRGAWDTWNLMLAQRVTPTSITIGCMVEALVLNGDTKAGYELLTELRLNPQTRGLINSVMYGSVLKGFSHLKRFDSVWAVYGEMLAEKVEFTIVTFNGLIDACARNSESRRIPCLLEEMCKQKVKPNMVTYSTIVKSYCNEGRIDKAFELLEDMKQTAEFRPDEITYNTLLDGCARLGLYERGIAVLDEMQVRGVRPSCFTLSLLAKLARRSRQPDKAIELCREISQKYHIKLNTPVYNSLIQAYTVCGDGQGACDVFGQMLAERGRPDGRTYTLLLRSCISLKRKEDAAGFLRAAAGLPGGHPKTAGFGARMFQLGGGLDPAVLAEALEGIANQCGDSHLAVKLLQELKTVPGIKLDPALIRRLASTNLRRLAAAPPGSRGAEGAR